MSHKNYSLDRRFADSLIAAKHISSDLLSLERSLATTKWFDYRFLTPMAATQRFADIFREQYRNKYAQYFDLTESEYKRGIGADNVFENEAQIFTSLWKARQHADQLGMPYEHFISFTINHLMDRGYRQLPAVSQLYSEHALATAEEKWNEYKASIPLLPARDPRYLSEHYKGTPAQNSYITLQVSVAKSKPSILDLLLAGLCFDRKTLPIDIAVAEFGVETVNKAKAYAGLSEPGNNYSSDIDITDLRPSCHSVPAAYSAKSAECALCEEREQCQEAVHNVEMTLIKIAGNSDPVRERKKKQAADRQRRRREKLRALKQDD